MQNVYMLACRSSDTRIGQHDVVQIAAPDCSLPSAERIAGLTDSPFSLTYNASGTYYYS